MKDCYLTATRDAHKLDQAMEQHFQKIGVGNDHTEVVQQRFALCGSCQRPMQLKQEKQRNGGGRRSNNNDIPRRLLFCQSCQDGHVMPRKGKLRPKTKDDSNDPVKCPICNFQVIAIARGDGYEGNGYNICPKCYSDPPAEYTGENRNSNMPCFSCSHPTCALAGGTQGGDIEVFACPFCRDKNVPGGGKVTLRKNTRGYVLSCSNYSSQHRCSYTIWLPRASKTVEVDDQICTNCSNQSGVRKLSFVWKPGDVPAHLGRESTACLLCDSRFRQDLQIQLPQMDRVGTNQHRSTNNRRSASTRGGGTNGNNAQNSFRGGSNNYNTNGYRRSNNNSNNNNNGYNNGRGGTGRSNNRSRNVESNAGGNVCYICNQPGHYANACPTRNSENNSGGNVCYIFNQPGHFANACPTRKKR